MRKILLGLAATAVIATPLAATAANAYTIDSTGKGFIGKGEVQSLFNLTNAKMQTAIGEKGDGVTFTSEQPATQALTQDVTQDVEQTATQSAHRVLSCTVTTGGDKKPVVFEADGYRNGTKTGTKTGSQSGTQAGSLDGMLSASIDAKARKTGQWTGWNVKGFTSGPTFVADNVPALWDEPEFGLPTFNGDFAFGNVDWTGWVSESQHNPADCDRNDHGQISDLVDETTYGEVVPGDVTTTSTVAVVTGSTEVVSEDGTAPATVFATIGSVTKPLG